MKTLFTSLLLTVLTAPLAAAPRVERLPENPIIRPEMLPGHDGENINGPSLIRVPAWVKNPLGRYYLYFAHHNGKYIRLAYADALQGPWQIYQPGALHLKDTPACRGHIASPDAIVDEDKRQIRLYFHGPSRTQGAQRSFVALSDDGLHFKAQDEVLGLFYFRVFQHETWWYAIAKGGVIYRSADGLTNFERGPNIFPGDTRTGDLNEPGARHVAVQPDNGALWVYYSNIGDAPERILRGKMQLTPDWRQWAMPKPEEVLRPERDWEGAALPVKPSKAGAVRGPENALRDPALFTDSDGRHYLLYSVAGENGIAIAELK
jgi:hypothetical protein